MGQLFSYFWKTDNEEKEEKKEEEEDINRKIEEEEEEEEKTYFTFEEEEEEEEETYFTFEEEEEEKKKNEKENRKIEEEKKKKAEDIIRTIEQPESPFKRPESPLVEVSDIWEELKISMEEEIKMPRVEDSKILVECKNVVECKRVECEQEGFGFPEECEQQGLVFPKEELKISMKKQTEEPDISMGLSKKKESEWKIKGSGSANTADQNEYSWNNCIKRESKEEAKILVEKKIMPSNGELNEVCRLFGKHSPILSDVCSLIRQHIETSSEDVKDVWPSFRSDNEGSDSCMSIVFVVLIKKNSQFSAFKDFEFCIKRENEHTNEENLDAREKEDATMFNQSTEETLKQISLYIDENADDLFDKHRNLNVILPSLRRNSTGYISNNDEINVEPCIALYVTAKGYIPLNEEQFGKEIGGFKINVFEGEFELLNGGPTVYHNHLKIGLEIHANGNDLGGTLGGFINHSVHKLCGITCAHVLYNDTELQNNSFEPKEVCQPMNERSEIFGTVVEAFFIIEEKPGIDVAFFKIKQRYPKDGSFPDDINDNLAGFEENNPMSYNSGEVYEKSQLMRGKEVYKFGKTSGITKGCISSSSGAARKKNRDQNPEFRLIGQIIIRPQKGAKYFALHGDSGALVLTTGRHGSVAIGIVEGRIGHRIFVTPICDILRVIGCSPLKMHQFT